MVTKILRYLPKLFWVFYSRKVVKSIYFYEQKLIAQQKVWDLEFRRSQLKKMREDMRLEYDRLREYGTGLEVRLEKLEKMEGTSDEVAQIKTRLEGVTKDTNQLAEQMKALDSQVDGEGGVNSLIDSHRSVVEMLTEHSKTL